LSASQISGHQKNKNPKPNRLSEFISESPERWKTNAAQKPIICCF